MSQYGSDSDRPRGRRHRRPDSDWAGYDAPQNSREFPDLQPIRPREARGRDARQPGGPQSGAPGGGFAGGAVPGSFQGGGNVPGSFQGGGNVPGSFQGGGNVPGAFGGGQHAPQAYQGQYGSQGDQYGQPEAPSGFGAPMPPSVGRHSAPQPMVPPGMGQPPGTGPQPPMTPPPASRPGTRRRGGGGWDDEDSDDPMAAFSERWRRRGQESADDGKRKRLYLIAGGVAVIAIAALVYVFVGGSGGVTDTGVNSLVTSFLPGELKSVPNACTAVSSGSVSQVLPGQAKQVAPPANTGPQSQCTWTLDHPPTYRVLEVNLTAETPSGLASGDGSATFNAQDAFSQAEAAKKKPSGAGQKPATVTDLPNLGSSAFSAFQQFNQGGSVMDMATVEVRYHNVIIQVVLNGIDRSSPGKTQYGPVSQSTLTSQAQTVAQQVTSKVTG